MFVDSHQHVRVMVIRSNCTGLILQKSKVKGFTGQKCFTVPLSKCFALDDLHQAALLNTVKYITKLLVS